MGACFCSAQDDALAQRTSLFPLFVLLSLHDHSGKLWLAKVMPTQVWPLFGVAP